MCCVQWKRTSTITTADNCEDKSDNKDACIYTAQTIQCLIFSSGLQRRNIRDDIIYIYINLICVWAVGKILLLSRAILRIDCVKRVSLYIRYTHIFTLGARGENSQGAAVAVVQQHIIYTPEGPQACNIISWNWHHNIFPAGKTRAQLPTHRFSIYILPSSAIPILRHTRAFTPPHPFVLHGEIDFKTECVVF